ncbi:MAG TPA: integrase [Pusillimonas sp.]|nr:integrase [Pusillimonas sp.]
MKLNARHRRICPTLDQALTRYMTEVSACKKSHYQELSLAKTWRATNLITRPLNRITPTDLMRLRDQWHQENLPSTVTRRLALLSHLYTVARKDWQMHWLANPVQLVRRPAIDDARDRRLFERIRLNGVPEDECPKTELEWLCRATSSPDLPLIMLIAVETGMRRSEITLVKREQIDLAHGVITLTDTKNGDTRYVPLSPFAKDGLRKHVVGKPMRGRIFDISPEAVTRAFIRARTKARKMYEALCKKYGRRPHPAYFRDLRFHDLRHESTSRLATVFQAHELAKVTGHRTTRMLLRYYHPHGRDLARKLVRSNLGRKQLEQLRDT